MCIAVHTYNAIHHPSCAGCCAARPSALADLVVLVLHDFGQLLHQLLHELVRDSDGESSVRAICAELCHPIL